MSIINDHLGGLLELTILHTDGSLTEIVGEFPAMHSSVDFASDEVGLHHEDIKTIILQKEVTVTFRLDKVTIERIEANPTAEQRSQNL